VLIGASVLMLAVVLLGAIGRTLGALFLALLAAYTIYTYLTERRTHDAAALMHEAEAEDAMPRRELPLWSGLLLAVGGIAAVVFGAGILVDAAIEIARAAGLSEVVIGLTLVAVGTSLPELATSVMAAIRRHADVAFGNIVGSNIFNVLGIAGLTAVVSPIPVPPEIAAFDIWAMLGAALQDRALGGRRFPRPLLCLVAGPARAGRAGRAGTRIGIPWIEGHARHSLSAGDAGTTDAE
jgi:cation:H+ antiporter